RIAERLVDAAPAWTELAAEIGASSLLSAKGCLYVYETRKAFDAAASDIALRRSYGVSQELLPGEEVARLERKVPAVEGGGLFFLEAMHVSDPGEVMGFLAAAARRGGVEFVRASATDIAREKNGVRVMAAPFEVRARTVVIAAGARSHKLAVQAGDRVPLAT